MNQRASALCNMIGNLLSESREGTAAAQLGDSPGETEASGPTERPVWQHRKYYRGTQSALFSHCRKGIISSDRPVLLLSIP
jgi:hypothetical protein